MKTLYTLALIATFGLALGAAAEPLEKPEQPATPVFLAGADSGGAGAGLKIDSNGDGLFLRGSCASVAGYCACVADGDSDCAHGVCTAFRGQCVQF